jgi:acyl-CoA reductase-like NAD-dependent aldehyde dehydrogenase
MAISDKVESPPMIVGGEELTLDAVRPVHEPATGEVLAHVPEAAAVHADDLARVESRDIGKPLKFSTAFDLRELEAGTVWIDEHLVIGSEMPHGGVEGSGFGKDMSMYALEEYTAIEHVVFELTGIPRKGWYDAVSKPRERE